MGKQLNMSDLNSLLDEEEARDAPKPKSSQKVTPAQADAPRMASPRKPKQSAEEMIAAKPSAFQAEHRQRLRQKKVLSFGQVPAFIADGFEQLATEAGLSKRAYLYQILREKGVDIPSQDLMDGRRL